MTHIDEGTIHAWLDRQLDAERAHEVETHVAQCAQCASAVAEARGLIAGSSRVLTALDDVPGGVVPKRASPPRRKWQAAKWVTGIAAAAMLVLTLTELRDPGTQAILTVTDSQPSALRNAQIARVDSPTAADSSRGAVASAPRDLTPRVASTSTGAAAASSRPPAAPQERAAADVASRDAVMSMPTTRKTVAAAPAPASADLAVSSVAAGAAGAGAEGAANAPLLQRQASQSAADLAGCYRVADASAARRLGPSMADAAQPREKMSASAARGRAPSAQAMAKAEAPEPLAIIRLDTNETAQGFVVRAESEAAGWWRADGDSARVNLLTGQAFTVVGKNRVPCP